MGECYRCDTGEGHHNGQGDGFGCRAKSVNVAPSAMPTRHNDVAYEPPNYNSWERGVVEHSPGMPFLDNNLDPIGVHEWQSVGSSYMKRFNAQVAAGVNGNHPVTGVPDPASVA